MPRAVNAEPAPARESSFVSLLSGWVQQGIDSFLATQRILVDLAMRQNMNAMDVLRGRLGDSDFCPVEAATELAGESTSNFIEAQKLMLQLAQHENELLMAGIKDRVDASTAAAAATDLLRRSIETFIEMQQGFLKIASKQTHNWLNAVKAGKTFDAEGLVELARDSMDTFVHSQKKFLDVIAEETMNAANGKDTVRKTKKMPLPELAKEATDCFIEAQKKLLDVAGKQMHAGMKTATRTMDMMTPFPFLPIPGMTTESVKNFMNAERELLDTVVTRTRAATKRPATTGRSRKRAARTIKVEAAHATA